MRAIHGIVDNAIPDIQRVPARQGIVDSAIRGIQDMRAMQDIVGDAIHGILRMLAMLRIHILGSRNLLDKIRPPMPLPQDIQN